MREVMGGHGAHVAIVHGVEDDRIVLSQDDSTARAQKTSSLRRNVREPLPDQRAFSWN